MKLEARTDAQSDSKSSALRDKLKRVSLACSDNESGEELLPGRVCALCFVTLDFCVRFLDRCRQVESRFLKGATGEEITQELDTGEHKLPDVVVVPKDNFTSPSGECEIWKWLRLFHKQLLHPPAPSSRKHECKRLPEKHDGGSLVPQEVSRNERP